MKKLILLLLVLSVLSGCCVFAAKYKVNTKGTVKTQSGQVLTSPANVINQNYYNNYYAQNYVANNTVNSTPVDIIEIVMDYSGSMANWIGVAKRSMSSIVAQIPETTNLGFRAFGHDQHGKNPSNESTLRDIKKIVKKGNKISIITETGILGTTSGVCAATEQVAPITSANALGILRGMNSIETGGATPLVYALDRTVNLDFAKYDKFTPKKIVLITDGGENCGGDPCAFAKKLVQQRADVHIDVVLVSSNSKALSCLASTTGGNFYSINNLSDFSNTITNSINAVPTPINVDSNNNGNNNQYYEYVK